LNLFLVEHPQELGLEPSEHGIYLVQENGPPVCAFKKARFVHGAGKGTFCSPKQDLFQQVFWNSRAMNGNVRILFPGALVVDRLCEKLFPSAGLVHEHNRGRGLGGYPGNLDGPHELEASCAISRKANRVPFSNRLTDAGKACAAVSKAFWRRLLLQSRWPQPPPPLKQRQGIIERVGCLSEAGLVY